VDEHELRRRWVETWKEAGPQLDAIRRREIQDADNLQVLALLESASITFCIPCRRANPPGWSKCRHGLPSSADDRSLRDGALPFEESMICRASPFAFGPGLDIRTCSAEDLVVLKLFASRPLDIRDAEGIVVRQAAKIDWAYVEEQLRPLAELKAIPLS